MRSKGNQNGLFVQNLFTYSTLNNESIYIRLGNRTESAIRPNPSPYGPIFLSDKQLDINMLTR